MAGSLRIRLWLQHLRGLLPRKTKLVNKPKLGNDSRLPPGAVTATIEGHRLRGCYHPGATSRCFSILIFECIALVDFNPISHPYRGYFELSVHDWREGNRQHLVQLAHPHAGDDVSGSLLPCHTSTDLDRAWRHALGDCSPR